jgi:hypothetical protein
MRIDLRTDYEKVLLLISGTIAIVVSSLLIFNSTDVDAGDTSVETERKAREGGVAEVVSPERVAKEGERLKLGDQWITPSKGGVPHRLAVSNLVLNVDGEYYDLSYDKEKPLWPPVPNAWWADKGLDITNPNCREEDSDGDGWDNLTEFLQATDPNDADSAPNWMVGVELIERLAVPYVFKVIYIGPEIQFMKIQPNKRVWFLTPGSRKATTGDGRFTVVKVVPAGANWIANPGKIIFRDNFDTAGSLTEVVTRAVSTRPEFQVVLGFAISGEEVTARLGEPFQFPGLAYELTLTKITKNRAELAYTDERGKKQRFEAKLRK